MKSLKIISQITRRESESFPRYLQEVSKLNKGKNLTSNEELELAKKIRNGDKKAENELIERNLSFVVSVAKHYQQDGCALEDLVSEGNLGLVKAARKFDESRGFKFISFAVWWIRQSILCYLNENSRMIRLPLNKIGQINKIKKIQQKFEQVNHRKPTTDEIVEEMKFEITAEDLEDVLSINSGIQSLNTEISFNNSSKSEGFTLEDLLIDYTLRSVDDDLHDEDLKKLVKKILNKMPNNQRIVIELYYGLGGQLPKSIDEIGEHLDLSRERIRQIKKEAFKYLEDTKTLSLIRPYIK